MKNHQTKAEKEEELLYGEGLYHLNKGLTRRLEEAYFAELESDEDWQLEKESNHDYQLVEKFLNQSHK